MNFDSFNIVHITSSVGARAFGMGPVALNLAKEQNILGADARIWCLDNETDLKWASVCGGMSGKIRGFSVTGASMLGLSLGMERAAASSGNTTVVHQHGIWTAVSRVTNIMRNVHGIPTVIAPHGSLEQWAIKRSWWKKRLAFAFYEKNNLNSAACLHACSEQEIAGFRDFGLRNPIAIISNGISKSWLESSGNAEAFRERYNIPPDKRIMLFLSRITPVKGLPMFMDALHSVRQNLDDWLLVIAGSDEFNHKAEVQKKIRQFHLENQTLFTGLLVDQTKRDAFAAAELFVLPTKRENYGIVAAEALGAGVPVLTTRGAPWADLVSYDCGWWVDVASNSIASALRDALIQSAEALKQMGQRGKKLVEEKYTWSKSARMTVELYEWLIGHRERPEFVTIE